MNIYMLVNVNNLNDKKYRFRISLNTALFIIKKFISYLIFDFLLLYLQGKSKIINEYLKLSSQNVFQIYYDHHLLNDT